MKSQRFLLLPIFLALNFLSYTEKIFSASLFRDVSEGLKALLGKSGTPPSFNQYDGRGSFDLASGSPSFSEGSALGDDAKNDEAFSAKRRRFVFATSALKGNTCPEMQDAYFPENGRTARLDEELYFYGVYDGHHGADAAFLAARDLHKIFFKLWEKTLLCYKTDQFFKSAIHDTFIRFSNGYKGNAGTTAAVAIIKKHDLFIANVGKCRAVLSKKGRAWRVSEDHTPDYQEEYMRIYKADGEVTFHHDEVAFFPECIALEVDGKGKMHYKLKNSYRVNGLLSVSRSLGDHVHKSNYGTTKKRCIIPDPFINQINLTPDIEFLILATDGIWNVMTDQVAVDFVCSYMSEQGMNLETVSSEQLHDVARALADFALGIHDHDNATVTLIVFQE